MEQLNGIDSLFILSDFEHAPIQIGAMMIYDISTADGRMNFAEIRTHIQTLIDNNLPLLKAKVQTSHLIPDKPYWVNDPNFNIDLHLEHMALPQPADRAALNALAERFYAKALNTNMPLWEAIFVEGLNAVEGLPSTCSALLLKMHHAVADGKTAVKLFSALHTLSPEETAPLLLEHSDLDIFDFSAPSAMIKASRAYLHAITSPFNMTRTLSDFAKKLWHKRKQETVSKDSVPRTRFNAAPSSDRTIRHIHIDMQKLKQLSEQTHCTINDIAIAIISGAMRDYLLKRDQLPKENLSSGMPIDTRSQEQNNDIGNQLSFAFINLYTQIKNPKERLLAIHNAAKTSKQQAHELGDNVLLDVADSLYPNFMAWTTSQLVKHGLIDKMPPLVNTVVSNVPGVPLPCYLSGAQLVDYVGVGFLAPTIGLFHVVSSIHSHVNISFTSCESAVSDPDEYQQCLQQSCESLFEEFGL